MAQKGLYWYKSVWNFKLPDIKDTAAKVIPELDDNFNLDYLAPSFRRAIVPQGSAQIATKASAYYSRFIIESAEPTWEVASLEITYVSNSTELEVIVVKCGY
ncbi:hypothetical protein NADFUDRAFT_43761 [Nadsonia fulvescens var. elongata DSM 6958]|uniref:Uncharacterized protein n=1 Tax=Nadsonia fulvescens var. elongata DSM 6958 TaxID=857566 RepID=A0A1E3PDF1_9ASCO|nr:hypothetical protein NADFUDRAFT_43761 [Nadsonia fulvescens var. elongata DSM 6958]